MTPTETTNILKYHPHLSFPGYGWLEPFSDADMPLLEEEFARDIIAAFDAQNTQILLLTEALRIAVKQNSHDMLMTDDELRRLKGKKPLECVVVEKDWPEYEPTWRAIEARVTGAQPAPSVPDDIVREVLRDCCGTFHGSRHRITCEKYKGEKAPEAKP